MNTERAKEWLKFALDDLEMAEILARNGKLNGALYHIQQSVEKSLKGVIVLYEYGKGKSFKTHHIDRLLKMIESIPLDIPTFVLDSEKLSVYAFTTRYPDDYVPVSKEEYEEAYEIALRVYEWAKGIIESSALE